MAKRTKQRGINFYFLTKKMHRQDLELPALEIWSLINEIKQLDVIDKILDIKNDKFMYLDFSEKNTTDTVSLFFTSAKNQFRADLIDRSTGKKRPNPKTDSEGEQQKTHVCLKISKTEVKVVIEKNGNGVSINQIIDYLNKYNRQLYDGVDFSISYNHLIRKDILQKIKELSRVFLAELHVTKQILGDDMLGYSNRTTEIKHDIVLNIKPKRGENIKNAVIDFFNKLNSGLNPTISRLTVKGKDDHKNDVTLDTLDFIMKDSAWFDLNLNGEVESARAFTILKAYFNQLF